MSKVAFRMSIPTVTRVYTPGSCCHLRNPMRHPPRRQRRPEFPALGAEQIRVPNETRKDPQCARWNTRESARPLSQEERYSALNARMQNSLV